MGHNFFPLDDQKSLLNPLLFEILSRVVLEGGVCVAENSNFTHTLTFM